MATDVEESDTDDHDRPDPPKRQRTRPVTTNVEHKEESVRRDNEWAPVEEAETQEFDEEERLSREKLKGWQAFQVAKGFVDNTINRVMEHYIMASTNFFLEDPWMRSFRGDEMEDTAVSMAIRNHGLVPSNNLSQANSFFAGTTVNFFSSQDCPLNSSAIADNFSGSTSTSSTSSSSAPATSAHQVEVSPERNWIEEKTDESDQEHDFLERAVAEAIKKKGLSTLSVDYG